MLETSRPDIIGGMFGLADPLQPDHTVPPFLTRNALLLANARSGFAILSDQLAPKRVWMPSYFCNHILKLLSEGKVEVWFYDVGYDLTVSSHDWIEAVRPNDLVVVTDYFGFPGAPECKKRLKEQGAVILEDASQALLSQNVGQFADFILLSPRKFLGIPDGGLLVPVHQLSALNVELQPPPEGWWLKGLTASILRREFDQYGGNRRWFDLFREAETEGPMGPYAMSELSRLLLLYGFDYDLIAEKRVANYRYLAGELKETALFPVLPDGVVPLGFPIRVNNRVNNRDQLRESLFRYEIYPPVHWPIQGVVPDSFEDSHRLSREIMTLPCDQRYGQADMERMVAVIRKEMQP